MPSLFRTAPATASVSAIFGFYWEMTHDRSGEVVGSGFSREQLPRLRPQAGYSYSVVELLAAPGAGRTEAEPCRR